MARAAVQLSVFGLLLATVAALPVKVRRRSLDLREMFISISHLCVLLDCT